MEKTANGEAKQGERKNRSEMGRLKEDWEERRDRRKENMEI